MPATSIMTGARAKVAIVRPGGQVEWVGLWNNVSFGLTYNTEPAHILGRYSAAAIEYTSQNEVGVSCSGYRVIGHGPFVDGGLPLVKDLLTADYMELHIYDRYSRKYVGKITNVRAASFNTSISARGLEDLSMNYIGMWVDDESTGDKNQEIGTLASGDGPSALPEAET